MHPSRTRQGPGGSRSKVRRLGSALDRGRLAVKVGLLSNIILLEPLLSLERDAVEHLGVPRERARRDEGREQDDAAADAELDPANLGERLIYGLVCDKVVVCGRVTRQRRQTQVAGPIDLPMTLPIVDERMALVTT